MYHDRHLKSTGEGKSMIIIPVKSLIVISYLYLLIPIIIFMLGWLKIQYGILFTVIMLVGFYFLLKQRYNQKIYISMSKKTFFLLVLIIMFWVFLSGIGGYFYQRWDWHGRNAVLHDLINYTWPVVYPETGNALVYYFIFWMVPAVIGKLFGWEAANAMLYFWSCIGIFISVLLLHKVLNINSGKESMILMIIFIIWGGLNILGMVVADIIGTNHIHFTGMYGWLDGLGGYQYTPNNGLIEWVFNQAIIPWIVVPLFLLDKHISILEFLGLCSLPFSPLPFIGIFIIFVLWAIYEGIRYVQQHRIKELVRDIFSIPNICAILSIFIVFLLFFSCNTATNGSAGVGGIGFYIAPQDFSFARVLILILFWILEFLVYVALIFKENKRNILFYIITISLLAIPLFRIGAGRDFCMRASIPALFLLMIFVIQFLLTQNNKLSIRIVALIIALSFASLSTLLDWGQALNDIFEKKEYPICADHLYTFSDKNPKDLSSDTDLINFVSEKPSETAFFLYLSRNKNEQCKERDRQQAITYRELQGLEFCSGLYDITPKNNEEIYLGCNGEDISLSVKESVTNLSTVNGCYRIWYSDYNLALDVPHGDVNITGDVQVFSRNKSATQIWTIIKDGEYYKIKYDNYALTYDIEKNTVYLAVDENVDRQQWNITMHDESE